jgi:hypothetical protein
MIVRGSLRSWTRSIHAPDRSVRASRFGRQPFGLEAPHLAARRGRPIEPLTADDGAHGGITGEPLGVVDVFVAGQPPEHRLPKQPGQGVTRVLATAVIEELGDRDRGEPDGIVQLTVGEPTAVRGDPGAVEFQLDPPVETDPQRLLSCFTHRVRHDRTPSFIPTS